MNNLFDFLEGKKTHIAVAGAIITALANFVEGGSTLPELVNQVFLALGLSGLRVGVSKK